MSEKLPTNQDPQGDSNSISASVNGDEQDLAEHLELRTGNNLKERRVDKYLQGRFSQFSRTTIQKLIKEKGVSVNGKIAKASLRLNPGDRLDVILPPPESKEIVPEDIPLNIIHEDDDIIVLNKQADLIVHPARSNTCGTLINGLVYYADTLSTLGGEFRPGIVHRLDRNTTGVMVVAKNDTAHWRLARQFELRQTKKSYLAIAHGVPELCGDCINQPLGVHPRVREKYAIRPESGKEAITFYEVLEEFRGYSLIEVKPKTGRTHQIRVHLAYIKHPVVADNMYGGKIPYLWQLRDAEPAAQGPVITRCALHASTLEFKHPGSEKMVKFEAPLPEDMQILLESLRKYRKV